MDELERYREAMRRLRAPQRPDRGELPEDRTPSTCRPSCKRSTASR